MSRGAGADAGQARDLDQPGGYLLEEVREYLGGAVLGEVAYHLGRSSTDVGQLFEVLYLAYRAAQSRHRLGGALVGEDPVVGLVFELHERHDRLEGANDIRVLQANHRMALQSSKGLYARERPLKTSHERARHSLRNGGVL